MYEVNKDDLKKQFASEWEKHYKLKILIDRGFIRQKCTKCQRMFWSKNKQNLCGDPSCIGYQFIGNTPIKKKLDYIDTWKTIEKYFTQSGHGYVKPYPTVARWRDDLYFTIASINDFQPYVVNGELEPPNNPLIVPQPCIRFSDISNVGVSGRHYTNFVMVGQHAFNTDKTGLFYWKEEAIKHDLNYLGALGIPEEELIFQEDVWAGGGNFGPSIEYFVRGLELGNCVFMQYEVTPNGPKELKTKVIDMGAGLSRLAWITSGEPTSYEVVFGPVISEMKKRAGVNIDKDLFMKFAKISGSLNEDEVGDLEKEKERVASVLGVTKKELFDSLEPLQALYATADHLCTLLFTVTDGMLPSNSGGGYNLRMILRRVFGFQQKYGYDIDYEKIIKGHADYLNYIFPHLKSGVETTLAVIEEEKIRYKTTKEKGAGLVLNLIKKKRSSSEKINFNDLLTLYKSNGIPPESVSEIAKENDIEVEVPGNFYALAREKDETSNEDSPKQSISMDELKNLPRTKTHYYSRDSSFVAKLVGRVRNYLVLDESAFYPEGGGQVADGGEIEGIKIKNVIKSGGITLHELAEKDQFKIGQSLNCKVDLVRRKIISRHHTSAHILNAAARAVLGPHIWQAGSNKDADKAHLDITHYRRITTEELAKIEHKVNEYIRANLPIVTEILPRTIAESKYGFTIYQGGAVPGKELRIVSIGEVDSEACGGTHTMISNTGEIGFFKIIRRDTVKDGVERIEYKCGDVALDYIQERERLLKDASSVFSVSEGELVRTSERFFAEWKNQRKKIEDLSEFLVKEEIREILANQDQTMKLIDIDESSLKKIALKVAESDDRFICLINKTGNVICACGKTSNKSAKTLLDRIFKELGGSGGGSDRLAQGKVKEIKVLSL